MQRAQVQSLDRKLDPTQQVKILYALWKIPHASVNTQHSQINKQIYIKKKKNPGRGVYVEEGWHEFMMGFQIFQPIQHAHSRKSVWSHFCQELPVLKICNPHASGWEGGATSWTAYLSHSPSSSGGCPSLYSVSVQRDQLNIAHPDVQGSSSPSSRKIDKLTMTALYEANQRERNEFFMKQS